MTRTIGALIALACLFAAVSIADARQPVARLCCHGGGCWVVGADRPCAGRRADAGPSDISSQRRRGVQSARSFRRMVGSRHPRNAGRRGVVVAAVAVATDDCAAPDDSPGRRMDRGMAGSVGRTPAAGSVARHASADREAVSSGLVSVARRVAS